jgi:hypothetical protein
MKLTQKESTKKELRLFNYEFSKFAVLASLVATSRISGALDLCPMVATMWLQRLGSLPRLRSASIDGSAPWLDDMDDELMMWHDGIRCDVKF